MRGRRATPAGSAAVAVTLAAAVMVAGCSRRHLPGNASGTGGGAAGTPPAAATPAGGERSTPPQARGTGQEGGRGAFGGASPPDQALDQAYEESAEYQDDRYGIRLILPYGWQARQVPDGARLTAGGRPEVRLRVVPVERGRPETALPGGSEVRSSEAAPLPAGAAATYVVRRGAQGATGEEPGAVEVHLVVLHGEQAADLWMPVGTGEVPEADIRRGLETLQSLAAGLAFTRG